MKKDISIILWAAVILFLLTFSVAQQQVVTEKVKITSLIDKVQNNELPTYQEGQQLIDAYRSEAEKNRIIIVDVKLEEGVNVVKKIGEVVKTKL